MFSRLFGVFLGVSWCLTVFSGCLKVLRCVFWVFWVSLSVCGEFSDVF